MALRRLLPAVAVLLALLASPAGGDVYSRKHEIDARLQSVEAKIAQAKERERALAGEIAAVDARIHGLATRVGDVSARLVTLEHDLALHRQKLARLNELYRLETARFNFLRREYRLSLDRLDNRLIDIYEGGEPSSLEVLLSADSFTDLVSRVEDANAVAAQDHRIADDVARAEIRVHAQRERTKRIRAVVASETRTIAVRAEQVRAARDALLASERRLAAARRSKREGLVAVRESKAEYLHEAAGLERASAALAASIRAAQASRSSYAAPSDSTPSAAGFIWPVNGPVVSPFGMRWGRMHEGIDIAVPAGTPIHAAASGRVVYAGWMDGYGNLVAIDHGRGLSTAYAHQSSIAVGLGQTVSQGQTIGYVGCTGHCFGPHLHFEVRVNGTPVDPLGYL
ncbi:MAG TPA: peptidoglycan DD-metalloendopeptidase family protein [Gaiellaceae bacterium]|nr:peptidoglycan DD-metalloendopeptidase family protein [Gaiellaceae bacterium]